MFEGTKHEKAMIAALAYIIGITSGFIAFGITNESIKDKKRLATYSEPYVEYVEELDSDTSTDPTEQDVPDPITLPDGVVYSNGYLYFNSSEGSLVLSAHINNFSAGLPEVLKMQGHHVAEPIVSESPDGRFVYFCEQQQSDMECLNFVFDKSDSAIRFAQFEDRKLITPTSLAASAYWATEGLHIGDYVSESVFTPWLLTQKDTLN